MKKMKQLFSKLLALGLTLLMTVSTCGTMVFADGISSSTTGKITVNNVEEGVTVTAYQIITVGVDESGTPTSPVWNSQVATWLKAQTGVMKDYVGDNNVVSDSFKKIQSDSVIATLMHDIAYQIQNDTTTYSEANLPRKTATITTGSSDTSVTFDSCSMGQYLIVATGGEKVYRPTSVDLTPTATEGVWSLSDQSVGMKGETPTVTKTVPTVAERTVGVGSDVTFLITALVPNYPEDAVEGGRVFKISDTLPTGLVLKENTLKVTTDSDGKSELDKKYYTAKTTELTGDTFEIEFNDSFLTSANKGKNIYVSYTATVTKDATGTSVTDGKLENEADITYSNNPYVTTSTKTKQTKYPVYTYTIKVEKKDSSGKALTGAKFKVSTEGGSSNLKFSQTTSGTAGSYYYDPTSGSEEVEVGSDGTLTLAGLDTETYVLTETAAPSGYIIPNGTVRIVIRDKTMSGETISAETPDGTLDDFTGVVTTTGSAKLYTTTTDDGIDISKNVITVKVQNTNSTEGLTLPTTGGIGTTIFTVGGILLMAGAAAYMIISKKKKSAE